MLILIYIKIYEKNRRKKIRSQNLKGANVINNYELLNSNEENRLEFYCLMEGFGALFEVVNFILLKKIT